MPPKIIFAQIHAFNCFSVDILQFRSSTVVSVSVRFYFGTIFVRLKADLSYMQYDFERLNQHALVQTEEKPNWALAVEVFKRNNPALANIRVVMTDKALHEKEVLHQAWPKAKQLLCRWHVETWLKRQCSRLGGLDNTGTKKVMKGLVNDDSHQQYDEFNTALLETLGGDKDNHLYQSFKQHLASTTDEWVIFKRGGVPHLQNHTNNRLESKWGRVKEIVDGNFTIDELVSMLITLQDYDEERYLAEFHRVGSCSAMAEDPELTTVAMQLRSYAFKMVAEQHKLANGPNTSYDIEVGGTKTTLTNPATGSTRVVDARTETSGEFPNLTQVSSAGSISLTQLSFTDPNYKVSQLPNSVSQTLEDDNDAPTLGPEPSASLSPTPAHQDISRNVSGNAQAPIVFASPPKSKGLTRRLEKKKVSGEDMKEAKRIQTCIRGGKKAQVVKLSHMKILTGPFSNNSTMQLVAKLKLPCAEIRGSLVVQSYKSG
ncbi:unnamed protein product [Phytophthora fragariaefolia]|uniref:Unnamed protein product n=1 Tax=Phytophthora fragariaefolia TaxID=1490495 RepID=A0A9W6U6A4_9STRA|nr:unnamed protein product [Phytophthora fragariaefolia]